jgi:uncharacterized protein (TIGR00730 family)
MRLCVFCGSSEGADPAYREAATALGQMFAEEGIGLVYGGGRVGLMGAIADAALSRGGEVIGVHPGALVDIEVAHRGLTELRIVSSMHERKALMADLADGFVGLPGGLGTFEELLEVWTWGQLGHHRKPVSLFNVAGFYNGLLTFLDSVVERGFVRRPHPDMLVVSDEPSELLRLLRSYSAPDVPKLIHQSHDRAV